MASLSQMALAPFVHSLPTLSFLHTLEVLALDSLSSTFEAVAMEHHPTLALVSANVMAVDATAGVVLSF